MYKQVSGYVSTYVWFRHPDSTSLQYNIAVQTTKYVAFEPFIKMFCGIHSYLSAVIPENCTA